jgi:DNA-binding MarR family transcriptional regulator
MNDVSTSDPLTIVIFSEIATIDQLAKGRLSRALPRGLEVSQFAVLNLLSRQGVERTPAQLARAFNLTKGAMTNTLGKLESAGFVHIRPDWDDARRKIVTISPAGRRATEMAVEAIAPVFDDVIADLGPEKVRALLRLLRQVRSILTEEG